MKFNIGISLGGYNAIEHLDTVFNIWKRIKNGALSDLVGNLSINVAHACFIETFQIGYPIISPDGTLEKFRELREEKVIDNLICYDSPMREVDVWTKNLDFFSDKNIDLLWLLGTDEIFTLSEIEKILVFIQNNVDIDHFYINFKNYFASDKTWIDDFIVPRVWRADRHGGISHFYQDDWLQYNDGSLAPNCSKTIVPDIKPAHFSWCGSEEFLKRKINFHKQRNGICSYEWNERSNKLDFNMNYYNYIGKSPPTIYIDE